MDGRTLRDHLLVARGKSRGHTWVYVPEMQAIAVNFKIVISSVPGIDTWP